MNTQPLAAGITQTAASPNGSLSAVKRMVSTGAETLPNNYSKFMTRLIAATYSFD